MFIIVPLVLWAEEIDREAEGTVKERDQAKAGGRSATRKGKDSRPPVGGKDCRNGNEVTF